ncbi:hypothetical protein CYY_002127 [Polysphondylium violaceum]|uniref:Uncharacterized protein n=1 Tax=Polysphondylium violaceum TaxID=133409 RepID=A0A8J4UVH0_9MYCE|nr:hypothetical protein CYY_002127 [Polysphondylium violaceum]
MSDVYVDQILNYVQLSEDVDPDTLQLLYNTYPHARLPIYCLVQPILKGDKELLEVFFRNQNFADMVKKVNFPFLVNKILKQRDPALFNMVMEHFNPPLYEFIVQNAPTVQPYLFFLSLKQNQFSYPQQCFGNMGLGQSFDMNSLGNYSKVITGVEVHMGIEKEDIRLLIEDRGSFILILKDWNIDKINAMEF